MGESRAQRLRSLALNKLGYLACIGLAVTAFSFALNSNAQAAQASNTAQVASAAQSQQVPQKDLSLTLDGRKLDVTWEKNKSVAALKAFIAKQDQQKLTITSKNWGAIEHSIHLPEPLPKKDTYSDAEAGDIVLFKGEHFVILYESSSSWRYTKLGHVNGMSHKQLRKMMSAATSTVCIYFE